MNSPRTTAKLLIHGGAGVIARDMDKEVEASVRAALNRALQCGFLCLARGEDALDAAVAAVVALEDAPQFNAGHGAVYTHAGTHELDAAVMDGKRRQAGAVACVHQVRNPVLLAQAVMEHSPHVLLVGDGAEAFACEHGIVMAEPDYFHTETRRRQWQEALRKQGEEQPNHFGTVGAVALDSRGGVAAATSTGGMTDKYCGRVGDSPMIGAGTYANAACAVSGTGWGEFYIRAVAAHTICMRVAAKEPLEQVAEDAINHEIPSLGGHGGAIVLGADGRFALPFNTVGMFRGWIGGDDAAHPHVAIWPSE